MTKPVIKAHGSSNALAFQNAIRQGLVFAQSGYIQSVEENIEYMKLERPE
ncbi:hypothetical protein RFF05_05800 [Bengtsoniella intestinalis]